MTESLHSALTSADPLQDADDARTDELVRRMAVHARAAAEASPPSVPWWKRRRTLIPLGIGSTFALTAGALAAPLTVFIDDLFVEPDMRIPVTYTTDTGMEVSCHYAISYGDPRNRTEGDEKLAAFVAAHDWEGFGQRVYDLAISDPFIPGVDGHLDVDTQEMRDVASLYAAIQETINAEIPAELRDLRSTQTLLASSTSNCQGELH